jgi:exopolysaccharide biosynthesis polyprenyl glycosylphosphotransferase
MEAQAATSTGAATKTLPAGDTVVALDRGRTAERGGVRAGRRDSVRRHALALSDMVAIVGAYLLVWVVDPPPGTLVERAPLLAALPLWVVVNKLLGLYDRDANLINKSSLDEFPAIAHSIVLGTGFVFLVGGLVLPFHVYRHQALWFALLALATTPAARGFVRAFVRQRFSPERILVIGSGSVADMVCRKLAGHDEYGIELVGYVDESWTDREPATDLPHLGEVDVFDAVAREHDVERVVVTFSSLSHEQLLDVISTAKRLKLKVSIVPRLFEAMGHSVEIDSVQGMTLMGLSGLSRTRSSLLLKRTIDVCGAGLGLLVLSPLLVVVAVAIKLTSPGPVLFAQRRIGRDNTPFRMLKLRTMYEGSDRLKAELAHLNEASEPMFKIERDPRVTPLGRFLRRMSVDELPQLWNVLRGEMSLVGPRPLIPSEDAHVIGWHRDRLDLTPGLTGPWQVMGRTSIPFHEMIKLDYLYVAEWSLWNDVKLLLRTAPVVLGAKGQ